MKEGNMNTNLASFIVGLIIDENDRFYFVQKDGQTYALAKEEGQHTVGDTVKGFAYTDMKQKTSFDNSRSDCNSGSIWLGER